MMQGSALFFNSEIARFFVGRKQFGTEGVNFFRRKWNAGQHGGSCMLPCIRTRPSHNPIPIPLLFVTPIPLIDLQMKNKLFTAQIC